MKTAVSMPDELFQSAEQAARRLKLSRSELYAQAISAFLKHHESDSITERLNEIYTQTPAKVDPALFSAHLQTLDKDSW